MSSSNAGRSESPNELLGQLVADYVRAVEQGGAPDRAQLLAAHPELADDLRDFFRHRDRMEELLEPLHNAVARALHVRCPHCHRGIELIDHAQVTDLSCPSCGSNFSLVATSSLGRFQNGNGRIGQFQLVEQVGVGQFGSVWKARDLTLERTVAIKVPRNDRLSETETEMFLRDARLCAQLRHPNIVGVHEVGRQHDTIYIVSDFVHGATLKEWIAVKRLTSREAAELCVKIAAALHHAHESGVIHRDLKPGNIMMDLAGEPHLVDFGLAKRDSGEITMTLDGQILGTPAYMSPEQARGEGRDSDRRTDVYSLGVILYELLTGELPFRGEKRMLIVQIINDDPPPPRRLDNNVPRDLQTICLKCLEKQPAQRYGTAHEFAEDLQRFLDGQPIRARSVGQIERAWRWCRRNSRVAFLSTTVLLLLTTLAVVSPLVAVHQAGLRRDRETAIAQARDAALQALLGSSTDDVLEVVRSLHRYGAQVGPLLEQKLADPTLTDKQQLHVRLARLLGAPEHVNDLRDRMLGGQTSPKELDIICRALREFAQPAAMAPALRSFADTIVDPNVDNHSRFRAACAAASIDPDAVQWETAADDIVGYLVMQPPIDIPDWLKLLRPVAHTLRGPLEDVFHHPQSNAERVIATMALAMFLEDDAEPIIELIKLADAPELVELVRELRPHGERAVMRLLEELKSDRMPSVVLNHPRAWDCPETVLEQFKASRGMITPRYAICQSLALAELEPLAERLREGGYRPIKCRPYRDGHQLLVAAVWIRDPTSWRLKVGLTAEEVQTLTSRWSAEGMRPADVAGYDPEPGLWRCVAIWVTDDLASHEVHLALLLRDAEWQASSDKLMAQRYVPVTTQIAQGQDEEVRRCQIWYKPGPRPFRELRSRLSSARSLSVTGKLPVDISVYANLAGQPRYGAVWHRDQTVDSYVATELAPDELLQKCRELERREYLPAGISVVRLASVPSPVTACVWHRPVQTAEAKRRLARAKANIAIALLQLGETASVLPYLKPSSDPQFTTDLVHGVPLARVNPETILEPLEHTELQSDTRQTLLLMLAGYGTRSLSEPRQRAIRQQLLELYHTDPDPGIHSAAQRLLRHWLGDEPTAEAMPTTDADDRRWHVTPHGLTMAHIELDATSSANAWCEGRVIAVDTKETTLALFRQFRPAHQLDETPGVDPNHPVTNVSWYDAVGFCQFLNEQEGIPESEWCYLPNDDGEFAEGMRIAPGFVLKTGYRLLTAQEWKQSAAAGQDFFFGHDSGLLQYYGWSAENSPKGPSEVGRLLPNFHGLFDVHGNVMEWCHDSAPTGELRSVLGGHFGQLSRQIQAHLAVELPAAERNGHTGLRVARTLRGATTEVFAKAERFAQRGDWEAACREIEQALKQRPNEWFYRCQLARLKLYLGDMDEYRQECHCLLQQLRDPEASKHFTPIVPFATITHEIGIALIGSPNTLEDWTPLIEQATKYADVSSGNKRTLAMVHFRNGDFATSSQLLAEVRPKQQSFGLAKTMFFQAMAYQKLGQETEARRCFDDGVKKFAELKAELREGYFGPRWRGWIYCTLLEHEARQALGLAL